MTQPMRDRIETSFGRQTMMQTLGARLLAVEEGLVRIGADCRPDLAQQHGHAHAALVFAIGDSAAGYAALTVTPEDREVLTAEMKINLLAPASGRLVAEGRVVKAGRRLVIVTAEVWSEEGGRRRQVALLQGTMIPVDPD